MHWTADDVVKVITALAALVGAVGGVVAAFQGKRAHERAKSADIGTAETNAKVDVLQATVDSKP